MVLVESGARAKVHQKVENIFPGLLDMEGTFLPKLYDLEFVTGYEAYYDLWIRGKLDLVYGASRPVNVDLTYQYALPDCLWKFKAMFSLDSEPLLSVLWKPRNYPTQMVAQSGARLSLDNLLGDGLVGQYYPAGKFQPSLSFDLRDGAMVLFTMPQGWAPQSQAQIQSVSRRGSILHLNLVSEDQEASWYLPIPMNLEKETISNI